MSICLKYGEDDIKGDSKTEGHEGWVEISSFQWGVGRGITSPTGSEADREGSLPSVSEIVVTKTQDSSSPGFFRAACGTDPLKVAKTVQIDFLATGQDTSAYLSFTLDNCLVSGYSMSSGGDRPTESVSLNFTKITMVNAPGDATTAAAGGPDRPYYDLSAQGGG
jgi:type VI secretion system secreted protein Hcp